MANYNDYINTILPGNYALTKSMELTKVQSSGTLWYTKKFLVLYYYVFLSKDITSREYISKVKNHFDTYISSLPESVHSVAKEFFYPQNQFINFNSDKFLSFLNFASKTDFRSNDERNIYYQNAKKCYFALLMNSGGQTGVKKLMKKAMEAPSFVYSSIAVQRILKDAAIASLVEDANVDHSVHDRSIKYILSKKAIDIAIERSKHNEISFEEVEEIVNAYPMKNPNYKQIENDTVAFIRNERQILYYYGYFHSKSSGASDMEFSSLTPVGELALVANAEEFLAIWEHQKIKMISQPATADFNDVAFTKNSATSFSISRTPYLDIILSLIRNEVLSLEQYKYILSRKNNFDSSLWSTIEKDIFSKISTIKKMIDDFNRQGDRRDEDFRKELLKYILGIRSDLSKDEKTNFLGCVSFSNGRVKVVEKQKLLFISHVYALLNDYKVKRYESLFAKCEQNLLMRYNSICEHAKNSTVAEISIDPKIKIDWDLYNIHVDKFIYLGVLLTFACINLGIGSFEKILQGNISRVVSFFREHYDTSLKMLGLKNIVVLKKTIGKVVSTLINKDFSAFLVDNDDKEEVLAKYKNTSLTDLKSKIKAISAEANADYSEGRVRNATLVSLMKSYYMQYFDDKTALKCECCGNVTFLTQEGEPYVEFHHLIPFNIAFGPDHYLNLFALCPNCHRKLHYINMTEKHEQYVLLNSNNHLQKSFVERLAILKEVNLLRSYHLEYLLAEKAISLEEYNTIAA